ncbi:PucR family transcriptional regulator [Streptomyces sp. NBC_00356]|uniref:PucR family transcriptional regulator n=1 Tax=Streptomyces sp. NBC_00356 TaxID=2975724 RepID=UPI002E258067
MHVGDLLEIDDLELTLLRGGHELLGREISGVTATDLDDPTRFLQRGDIVLSGLVWWNASDSRARTERFVSALARSGATALLAGEETHGSVPADVVTSCEAHGVALLAVPAHTNFRAITEAVYRRKWSDLSRRPAPHFALPENVRAALARLLSAGSSASDLLACALDPFGSPPAYVLTATGRTIARTPPAPELSAAQAVRSLRGPDAETLRVPAESTPYDTWYLHLPQADGAPPRALRETAEVVGQHRHDLARTGADARRGEQELIALVDRAEPVAGEPTSALASHGPLAEGPWRVIAAAAGDRLAAHDAEQALREALLHLPSTDFATGTSANGEAVAVVRHGGDGPFSLSEPWALLHGCCPDTPLYAGVSTLTTRPTALHAALTQARFSLVAARHRSPDVGHVSLAESLTSLESLLDGVPADVRTVFSAQALGPLADSGTASHAMLLETLKVFLAHNCSWARTAEALHLHVNTVHYRIGRVEALTGRDLSRLDHKLDLHAALLSR